MTFSKKLIYISTIKCIIFFIFLGFSTISFAEGLILGVTRIIYPADAIQSSVSLANKSGTDDFLIQSWVEDEDGNKTKDFIVTPPLYISSPGHENLLRIVATGVKAPMDKEKLYYFNTKAIPSVQRNVEKEHNAGLVVATVMQIKLLVRPAGLKPVRSEAEKKLDFFRQDNQLGVSNKSPYYITLVNMKAGGKNLDDVMIPPNKTVLSRLPTGSGNVIEWNSIDDYGGMVKGSNVIR